MKLMALIFVLSFTSLTFANETGFGSGGDFGEHAKKATANRGERPMKGGRGPASASPVEVEVLKTEKVEKGLHIDRKKKTFRDVLIQPKY